MLAVLNQYTPESLTIEVERSITAQDVIATLQCLFAVRAVPAYIRSDNGPESIADAIKKWLADQDVGPLYIEPGSPWENAYSESFISHLEDELLNGESFGNIRQAKVLVEQWLLEYNPQRPRCSLGYLASDAFAANCIPSVWATPRPRQYSTHKVENSLIASGT